MSDFGLPSESCSLTLSFPSEAKISVSENDKIEKGQVLAVLEKGKVGEFDLSVYFQVNPQKVKDLLKCSISGKIEEGEILAQQKGFLGKEKVFKSPLSGTVQTLTEKGVILIKTEGEKEEIVSPFSAKVKKTGKGEIVLEFKGLKLKGSSGGGKKVSGTLAVLGEREGSVTLEDLRQEKGEIFVFGGEPSFGILHKAEAMGTKGVVCGSLSEKENLDLTYLVIGEKGFILEELWLFLKGKEGKEVFLNGEEKELIIPE